MKSIKLFFLGLLAILMMPISGVSAKADSMLKGIQSNYPQLHYNGIDLSDVVSQLGNYVRKYEKQIWRLATQDITLENYMTKVSGVTDEYTSTVGTISELLQPYQKAFTPKGEAKFIPRTNKVRQIKIDYIIDDIDDIYRTYLAYLASEGLKRTEWPMVKYIVNELMVPQIRDEIAEMSVNGEYAAPTPGTAGDSLESTDGVNTIIANEITATNLTPIVTGSITQANIIDKIEQEFVDALPTRYKKLPEPIIMAEELKAMYWRAYRGEFGGNSNYTGKERVFVDGTKKEIIGIPEMNGSQRMIHTPKKNFLCMYDKLLTPNKFEVQPNKREVIVMSDFKRGYGFRTLDMLFVNDQA